MYLTLTQLEAYKAESRGTKCNDKELACFGDVLKIQGGTPEQVWEHRYDLLKDFEKKEGLIVTSIKMDHFFRLDRKGNEIDGQGRQTGFRVNGPEGKNIGTWSELFVLKEWAEKVIEYDNDSSKDWQRMHPESSAKEVGR